MISRSFFLGLITTAALLLATYSATNAQKAEPWMLDKAHTSVNFSINHFFSPTTGKFENFDGEFTFSPDDLKNSKVSFTIEVSSINTADQKRDKHLLSEDFFNAEKFPKITFVAQKFKKKSATEFLAIGKLTIRDVTKEVKLPVKITGQMEHPMMKGTHILGLSIQTTLNRTDYGVGVGSWAATAVVGDEVDIEIHMELNQKK